MSPRSYAKNVCMSTQHHVFGSVMHSATCSHSQLLLVAGSLRLTRSRSLRMSFSLGVRKEACIGVSGSKNQTGTDSPIVSKPQARKIICVLIRG